MPPQCGQPTVVETDASNTHPHEQQYEARSSGPPAAHSRACGAAGCCGCAAGASTRALRHIARRPVRGRFLEREERVRTVMSFNAVIG